MAPYKSDAQRKFFHTATAKKKGITQAMVDEYDSATKGKVLPKKSKPDPKVNRKNPALQNARTMKGGSDADFVEEMNKRRGKRV